MKLKMKTAAEILVIVAFAVVIGACALLNARMIKGLLSSADKSPDAWQSSADSIETSLKSYTWGRGQLIDLYGVVQRVLNRNLVGNFEFIRGRNGIMQHLRPGEDEDSPEYIDSLVALNEYAKSNNIPFVYLTQPDRTAAAPPSYPEKWSAFGARSKRVGAIAQEKGIDCLNLEELMVTDKDAPSFEEYFLRTDGHSTTYGEFWAAKCTVNYLSEKYGIAFPDGGSVFDLNNYTVKSFDFYGNLIFSSGHYYVGGDQFEIYHPNFKTELTLHNPLESQNVIGTFEEVMLNGYEESGEEKYMGLYWITDFGHFQVPYYEYINELAQEDAPELLVICDSTFMRGFSYLTLACKKLTVLDPRFFYGKEYLANELAVNRYDAVVITGQSFTSGFDVTMSLPDLPHAEMISTEDCGAWTADQGICPGIIFQGEHYDWATWHSLGMGLPIDTNADMVQLYGWAVDFDNNAPFQTLYLKVGDIILPCDYGMDAPGVVEAYGMDSMLKSYFRVEFPASYLKDGTVTEVSFYGVSTTGQYLYGPVTYQLGYM